MRIESPLSHLRDVLTQVRKLAADYQATLVNNEAATRAVLIDPLLRALGWDTANTFMVEVEKTAAGVRADYALYDSNGKVATIVEAKKLGEILGQFQNDVTKYAFAFGVDSVFLTNGVEWRHYTSFNPQSFAPSKVCDLTINDLGDVAAYLVQELDAAKLWPDDGGVDLLIQQVAQLQSDLATLRSVVATLQQQTTPQVVLPPPPVKPFVALKTLVDGAGKPVVPIAKMSPSLYRRPDGQEIPVTAWKHVLIETCKYVLANAPAIPIPYPDRAGKKISLFSDIQPPNGISNVAIPHGGKTVYVYCNYDSTNSISNALYVLKLLPTSMRPIDPAVL